MERRTGLGIGVIAVLAAGAVGYVSMRPGYMTGDAEPATEMVPLFDNLGTYNRAISSTNTETQRYFDQGLRLTYAFNHEEAIRAFEEATRLDADCAICYWGIAYAYGPNINAPMDENAAALAYQAIQQALSNIGSANDVERALIEALATRYEATPSADRSTLDAAYAAAMADVKSRFPDDLDVITLHGEAVMDLQPWDYWTRDGTPRPGMAEVIADLERVLATDPNHPGACHYYIHAVEAAQPEKAVACAERLASLMPGAGHLVHMPAHIYIRVGRWADAITANEHAVHSDETYIADQRPTGLYPMAYYPHNYHFLSFAATMAARSDQAITAARAVVERVPVDLARAVPPLEPLLAYAHLTLATFGRWDDVLNEAEPPADLQFATALTQYARGTAHAARNEMDLARAAHTTVRSILQATDDPLGHSILDIANHALAGEIAMRSGDLAGAESHFRQAATIEDELMYMEPPHWHYPIRHSLGSVLMQAGSHADAERVYREDLVRFPENAWSLYGLSESLRAQGKVDEAGEVARRMVALGADTELTASRF